MRDPIRCYSLKKTKQNLKGHKYTRLIKIAGKNSQRDNQLVIKLNSNQQSYLCCYGCKLLDYCVFYDFLEGCKIAQTPENMKIIYLERWAIQDMYQSCSLLFSKAFTILLDIIRMSSINHVGQVSIAVPKYPRKSTSRIQVY